jgi:MFS family permease
LAVRIGLRRFWPVFGLYFLFGLLAGLAAVLLALPILIVASAHVGWLLAIIAIVYILAGLPVSAYLIGFIAIAYVYVVLENMGPFTALNTVPRRGKTAGGWRLLLLGAAIMALSYVPALVVGALPDAIAWLFAVKLAGLALMNVTIFVYATAVETVAAIDYRNRSTGADLAQLLEARARA